MKHRQNYFSKLYCCRREVLNKLSTLKENIPHIKFESRYINKAGTSD